MLMDGQIISDINLRAAIILACKSGFGLAGRGGRSTWKQYRRVGSISLKKEKRKIITESIYASPDKLAKPQQFHGMIRAPDASAANKAGPQELAREKQLIDEAVTTDLEDLTASKE
jgi:hypothetical protein